MEGDATVQVDGTTGVWERGGKRERERKWGSETWGRGIESVCMCVWFKLTTFVYQEPV